MVDRPYHDYSTDALLALRRDLEASQAQIEDQRADYLVQGGSRIDDLGQLRKTLSTHRMHINAINQELNRRQEIQATHRRHRVHA